MKKQIIAIILSIIIILGLSGGIILFASNKSDTTPSSKFVVDDTGRNVTLKTLSPQRIVSIMPVCTEIVYALGLGDKIVAVDDSSNYPQDVLSRVNSSSLKTVGDPLSVNIETVVGLNPDLVLSDHGDGQSQTVQRLTELGIPVVVLHPKNLEGILSDILLTGRATGTSEQAQSVVSSMNNTINQIVSHTENLAKPKVYVEYYFDGSFWTVGDGSFINELITKAGATNVFGNVTGEYIATNTEEIAKANPDIIIISSGQMSQACGLTPDVIRDRTGWSSITAVKNNAIYEIDENTMIRPGPRIIDGLQNITSIVHPGVV
jgi:iron complex transport system substrate-binding protein